MLRASAARAPLLCTECLQHISLSTSTRASSNSAFGSRVQDSPSSEDHAHAPLGYSSRSSQRYNNGSNNGQSSSSYERYSGNNNGSPPPRTRSHAADRPPKPQHLLKDWKTLTPMSAQAKQQQRREDGSIRNNNNNYRSTNQANHRFAPREASSSPRQTSIRHDGPSSSYSYGRNQHQQQPAYQERSNRNPASDYGNYTSSRSSPATPTLGHRGNLKNQAAAATRYDATSISEKDKPKQVNFGQGSALAAFALKKNSKGKEKETSSSSATANARQQASVVQKRPALKPLARRKTRAYAAPKKIVDIPATVSVNALSQILNLKLRRLQFMMEKMGITDTRPDKRECSIHLQIQWLLPC
jgi:hypothetical protein